MDRVEYEMKKTPQPENDLTFILVGIVILLFIIRGLYQLFMGRQEVYIVNPSTGQSSTVVTTGTKDTTVDTDSYIDDSMMDNSTTTTITDDLNDSSVPGTSESVL